MDRLDEYETFARVAQTGGFGTAAASLGRTASAVSKQVKSLEERLGVRLLNRTTRKVALTNEGRAFLERVEGILGDVGEAEAAVADLHAEPRGVLRVGLPMDFGRSHLADPLAAFAAKHPKLTLEVELSDRAVDLIDEGLDVVVRIGAMADSSLVARTLGPCHRVVCGSPAYFEAHGTPQRPEDLRDHRRIGYAYENERAWRFDGKEGPVRVQVPVGHSSNNGEVTRALVKAGQGLALLPTFLVGDDLRSGELVAVLKGQGLGTIPIQAVYPHRKHLSAKVRVFVDEMVHHCGDGVAYWDAGLSLGT